MAYTRIKLIKKYIFYYLRAGNGRGHGIHSPFVYDFITHILKDKKEYPSYFKIESIRKTLLHRDGSIPVEDKGAGSSVIKTSNRKISQIASSSLKNKKIAQLLYRIVQYFKPANIVELGTSFGITTSYLASANPEASIITMEGSKEIANIAKETFSNAGCQHINLKIGDFKDTLPKIIENIPSIDFAFIDGNHSKIPTLDYFQRLLAKADKSSIFIFDDIHWSPDMEEAWKNIQGDPRVTMTIDLFFIGIVFFDSAFKAKQHFVIRF